MKKRKADDNFIKQPYYEGGDKAMKEFIGTHLRYPDLSRNANTEGEVHLKYEIDYKGIVTDVKLIGGLDQYCNDEAIRVIRMLRFIVPKIPKHLKACPQNLSNQVRAARRCTLQTTSICPFTPSRH